MDKHADRFTLATIAVAAVLAAFLTATTLPLATSIPNPILTWAITYTATALGVAKLNHLPPARTLYAATLMTLTALAIALTGLRQAIDALLRALDHATTIGLAHLTTTPRKAA